MAHTSVNLHGALREIEKLQRKMKAIRRRIPREHRKKFKLDLQALTKFQHFMSDRCIKDDPLCPKQIIQYPMPKPRARRGR